MWHDLKEIVELPNKCHIIKYEDEAVLVSFDLEGIIINHWFDIIKEEWDHPPSINFNKQKLLEHIKNIERELNASE